MRPSADWLFVGDIRTMDPGRPRTDALAVSGGKVAALGDDARELADRRTDVVELGARTMLPGFHDAHVHLPAHGLELDQLDLRDVASLHDALAMVAQRAATVPPSGWIQASGFALERWGLQDVGTEEADALERAGHGRPVILRSQDHHSVWGNRTALRAAGIDRTTPDPPEGIIARDGDGEPSGLLFERATDLLLGRVPPIDAEALEEALARAGRDLAARGITTVHHMALDPAPHWRAMARAASDESYPLRVWACIRHQDIEHAAALGLATGQGGARFAVGGAKFFADGALGSRTAWMLEPYLEVGGTGVAVDGPEVLAERMPLAIAAGLTPVVHAIGDAANRAVLDALEATMHAWRRAGLRPRIEHVQHLHPSDVARVGRLGVIASVQPLHMTFDGPAIRRLLGDRQERAYPLASLARAGATLALGSDTPVARPDVLAALRAAVTRIDVAGEVLGASERLRLGEALAALTTGAARAIGREHRSGMLTPGFDADLTVLSRAPEEGLDDLEVAATFVAGQPTYGLDAWPERASSAGQAGG